MIVFTHIPRTGGRTVQSVLAESYLGGLLKCQTNRPEAEAQRVEREAKNGIIIRAVTGHVPFGIDWHLGRDVTYVTVLRDPIERLMSFYRYLRTKPSDRNHPLKFDDPGLLFDSSPRFDNGMTKLLAGVDPFASDGVTERMVELAKDNLYRYALIGWTEDLGSFLEEGHKRFGWAKYSGARRNASEPCGASVPRGIEQYVWADYEVIRFAKSIKR